MTDSKNTSTQDVLTSIAANGALFGTFIAIFITFRLKFSRIYQPKSDPLVNTTLRPTPLPRDPITWLWVLLRKPPKFVIEQAGLDGYFFLRFLTMVGFVSAGGMLMMIVLFPVNAIHGKLSHGLDQLSISNVKGTDKYYAHVFMSWFFYGSVLFVIFREMYFYNSLRQAALASPHYAKKLSSRTVIFQTVPEQYLDEREFFKLFDGVKTVWIARGQRRLAGKVKRRQMLAMQLETALTKLLLRAMKAKIKAEKKQEPIDPSSQMIDYVPTKKRPTFRLLPLFGHKYDTIEYCKEEIPKIDKEIKELQAKFRSARPMNSVTVEFTNQYYAQVAFQTCGNHTPLHLEAKYIGVEPADIFWPNMRLFWWERMVRSVLAGSAIIVLILTWSIPTAFIGVISNLTYLTNKLHFLRFVYNLPDDLLGLITSLLPTVLLALLMLLLPIFIRTMAKIAGRATTQSIEYYTQSAYFAFQLIQVFLVTALSSSAAATVTQIVDDPGNAMELLASNLPKSSNFYISYLVLQGFSIAGGALVQIVGFVMFYIMGFLADITARQKWTRYTALGGYAWGTMYPVYANLFAISLAYAVISPMMMLFSFAGFAFLYVAYLHNLTYVSGQSADNRGAYYPRALRQSIVGLYLGEICLTGIFAVGKSWGCVVLELIMLGFTVFVHVQIDKSFDGQLNLLPTDCMRPLDGFSSTVSYQPLNQRALFETDRAFEEYSVKMENGLGVRLLADDYEEETRDVHGNALQRYLQPWKFYSFNQVRHYLPGSYWHIPESDPDADEYAYDYPDVSAKSPTVWIPRDPMGLSRVEIENLKGVIEVSDENAIFDNRGRVVWLAGPPAGNQTSDNTPAEKNVSDTIDSNRETVFKMETDTSL
ncbi:unnamed protein product [Kuraishia capsulata CBS 1993]|uniref:DUF221-domain-containing protein n=1 Tax=Kuraishia capsulata CBS 1993 TaxID=1382522 RepID=W6MUC4_9ASCO|nr:uncharacterized protein KUCA_T00005114001 [Kuraishia capsulata CBS 1993]CDK29127.1 unnamed protein product [Kuraishia capsulata CBS 1993]